MSSEPTPQDAPADVRELAERIGVDPENWFHNCHQASIEIVRAGYYEGARVARGSCRGVPGQHSWLIVPPPYPAWALDDEKPYVYNPVCTVIDPTLWSYDPTVTKIYKQVNLQRHIPHGFGNIWDLGGPPPAPVDEVIELTPREDLSEEAHRFLDLAAPKGLDFRGWIHLANSPTGGWPSMEIIEAMHWTDRLRPLVPIDILGHLTDINPSGAYLPGEEKK